MSVALVSAVLVLGLLGVLCRRKANNNNNITTPTVLPEVKLSWSSTSGFAAVVVEVPESSPKPLSAHEGAVWVGRYTARHLGITPGVAHPAWLASFAAERRFRC